MSIFQSLNTFQAHHNKNLKKIFIIGLIFLHHFSHATESQAIATTLRTVIHSRLYLTAPFIDNYGIARPSWEGLGVEPILHKEGVYFSAFSKETHELLASIQFFKFEDQENDLEMTIAVKKEHWHQGIASEVLKSLLPTVALQHPLSHIVAQSDYQSEQEENENLNEKNHYLSPYWDDLTSGDFLKCSGMVPIGRDSVTGFDRYYYPK